MEAESSDSDAFEAEWAPPPVRAPKNIYTNFLQARSAGKRYPVLLIRRIPSFLDCLDSRWKAQPLDTLQNIFQSRIPDLYFNGTPREPHGLENVDKM